MLLSSSMDADWGRPLHPLLYSLMDQVGRTPKIQDFADVDGLGSYQDPMALYVESVAT